VVRRAVVSLVATVSLVVRDLPSDRATASAAVTVSAVDLVLEEVLLEVSVTVSGSLMGRGRASWPGRWCPWP
jgi:hypothetical protein